VNTSARRSGCSSVALRPQAPAPGRHRCQQADRARRGARAARRAPARRGEPLLEPVGRLPTRAEALPIGERAGPPHEAWAQLRQLERLVLTGVAQTQGIFVGVEIRHVGVEIWHVSWATLQTRRELRAHIAAAKPRLAPSPSGATSRSLRQLVSLYQDLRLRNNFVTYATPVLRVFRACSAILRRRAREPCQACAWRLARPCQASLTRDHESLPPRRSGEPTSHTASASASRPPKMSSTK